jgi:hypothetical protein
MRQFLVREVETKSLESGKSFYPIKSVLVVLLSTT